jgi:hypothetical protein
MVHGVALQLIDRLVQFDKAREGPLADFVARVMVDFEAIHGDWLERFRRVDTLLRDPAVPVSADHGEFVAILDHELTTEALRVKAGAVQPAAFFDIDDDLGSWVGALIDYLAEDRSAVTREKRINLPDEFREAASAGLPDVQKRHRARMVLLSAAVQVQQRYESVAFFHNVLRRNLLQPS